MRRQSEAATALCLEGSFGLHSNCGPSIALKVGVASARNGASNNVAANIGISSWDRQLVGPWRDTFRFYAGLAWRWADTNPLNWPWALALVFLQGLRFTLLEK